ARAGQCASGRPRVSRVSLTIVSDGGSSMSEWLAETYADHSSLQVAMAGKVLTGLELDASARVLDVGCGDGKITASIAAHVPKGSVVGVDPSRSMIAHAAERFSASDHPNLRF